MKLKETLAKSILNKSKIYDYCINPYMGCQVSCRYCYARLFMGRYTGHKEPWGEFVDAKTNGPEILSIMPISFSNRREPCQVTDTCQISPD